MSLNPPIDEPAIPRRVQWPLAAVWISLGLHAAVIALVQVAPPGATGLGGPVIEARLVPTYAEPSAPKTPDAPPDEAPLLAPSGLDEALPVPKIVSPPEPAQPAVAAQPAAAPSEPLSAPTPASPVAIISAVDLTYYSARAIDVHPRALREIVPGYPEDADRQRVSGKVRLQLKLEADGRVVDVDVVSSTPPGAFDDAAVKAFRAASFAPALKNGRPVRALVLIEVVFDGEGHPR